MAHIHEVKPTDNVLTINPVTREIEGTPDMLAQRDHNSVRYIFRMPRYIYGHDMTSGKAEIHYNNIEKNAKTNREGVYQVDDLGVDAEDENLAVFTWLISINATQLKGSLNFAVTFECLTGEEIDYSWSTYVCKNGIVGEGMNNSDEVIEIYADVLEQWEQKLIDAGKGSEEQINAALAKAKESGDFDGEDGKSAYQIWLDAGNAGDEVVFLASLKGEKGDTGDNGADGNDGVSCTHAWSGTTLTITSASGTSSTDLKGDKGETGATGATGEKGDKGDKGDKGEKGDDGADGYTPVKGTDYLTEADKAELVTAVLAALPDGSEVSY